MFLAYRVSWSENSASPDSFLKMTKMTSWVNPVSHRLNLPNGQYWDPTLYSNPWLVPERQDDRRYSPIRLEEKMLFSRIHQPSNRVAGDWYTNQSAAKICLAKWYKVLAVASALRLFDGTIPNSIVSSPLINLKNVNVYLDRNSVVRAYMCDWLAGILWYRCFGMKARPLGCEAIPALAYAPVAEFLSSPGFIANAHAHTNLFNQISWYGDASGCCRWYLFQKDQQYFLPARHCNLLELQVVFSFIPLLYMRLELLVNWIVIYNRIFLLRTPFPSYLKHFCSTLCLRHLVKKLVKDRNFGMWIWRQDTCTG